MNLKLLILTSFSISSVVALLRCGVSNNLPKLNYRDMKLKNIIPEDITSPPENSDNVLPQTVLQLCLAQSSLVVASIAACLVLGRSDYGLGSGFHIDSGVVLQGILGTAPMLGLGLLSQYDLGMVELQQVSTVTQGTILDLLGPKRRLPQTIASAVALGLAAGVSEELIFRGLMQTELSQRFGDSVGIGAVSVLFGFLHAATPLYALLTGLAGVYLAFLYKLLDNLAVPMIAHTLYDALAITYMHIAVTSLSEEEMKDLKVKIQNLFQNAIIRCRGSYIEDSGLDRWLLILSRTLDSSTEVGF
eukprot:gene8239-16942_t